MIRKNTPQKADRLSETEMLTAWSEWRKWCSVMRVRDPRPTREELARGLKDELTGEERFRCHDYLKKLIFKCLRRSTQIEKNEKISTDWIQEFDLYMRAPKKRISAEDAAGFAAGSNYKDFIFYKAANSDDHPLQVIVGKTVGKQGYMMDVIKRHVYDNRIQRGADVRVDSLDWADEEKDDPSSLYDRIAAKEADEAARDVETIVNSLTAADMILWLAEAYFIPLDSDAVHAATGLRKSSLAVRRKKLMERIRAEFPDLTAAVLHLVNFRIFEKLQTEKSALPFLQAVEERERQQLSKRRTDYVED